MDDLSIREKYFTKRIDWNINEEISEEISKAAEKYNRYVINLLHVFGHMNNVSINIFVSTSIIFL